MKKNLTFLTGIAFLIAILVAGACTPPEGDDDPLQNMKKVQISCKAVLIDGKLHFEMFDSNDPSIVNGSLVTTVAPKTKVTWVWTTDSKIQEFVKIRPEHPGNKIMPGDAKKVLFTNKLRHKVPGDATTGEAKYDILFLNMEGDTVVIDPHLKIPPSQQTLILSP